MSSKVNPFGESNKLYKASLHTHSTFSDGNFSVAELVKLYREQSYDVLALTDHYKVHKMSDYDSIDTKGLLLWNGSELHPTNKRGVTLHLVGLNLPDDFESISHLEPQQVIDCIKAAGGECVIAHPYWTGMNLNDMLELRGAIGLEVYNASTRNIGKTYSMELWDSLLELDTKYFATAVDDTHAASDLFYGWTMISATENTPDALLESLRAGKFYSSTGPEFYKIEFDGSHLSVECSEVDELLCMSARNSCFCTHTQGMNDKVVDGRYIAGEHISWNSFEAEIPTGFRYLRIQIKDRNGKYAWTNPIFEK